MASTDDGDDDCTDSDKGFLQRVKDCMGGEKSGAEKRE